MSNPIESRRWIEALHNQNVEYEKLLRVILRLSQGQDKDAVVSAFKDVMSETAIEKEDCVLIGNLALKFDSDGRVIDLFTAIPGTTKRAKVVIKSASDL